MARVPVDLTLALVGQCMFSTLRIVAFSRIGVDVAMIKPVRVVNPLYAEMPLCWFRMQCHGLVVLPLLRIWRLARDRMFKQ